MCDCRTENAASVLAHLIKKEEGKHQINGKASQDNLGGVLVGNKLTAVGLDTFSVRALPIKKDGQLGKEKKLTMPVIQSFCPHCGEKYPTE